jgi:phosphatidylinositol phospholipase C delta
VLAARTSSASLTSSRQRTMVLLPPLLLKPGTEMLKVSVKSARRVKSRRVWLELAEDEMGALGLEMGAGSGQDIRICWEKGGKGEFQASSVVHD